MYIYVTYIMIYIHTRVMICDIKMLVMISVVVTIINYVTYVATPNNHTIVIITFKLEYQAKWDNIIGLKSGKHVNSELMSQVSFK